MVTIVEQYSFEASAWAVNEKALLMWVTGDPNCLKQTTHIMAKAQSILKNKEGGESMVPFPLTSDSDTFVQQIPLHEP